MRTLTAPHSAAFPSLRCKIPVLPLWLLLSSLDALLRNRHDDGIERVFGDICPQWHAKTGKLLITGGFAPVEVNADETWVISSEMAFPEARKDENNRVLLAKIVWSQP